MNRDILRLPEEYFSRFLKIRTKTGALVPFKMNTPQKALYGMLRSQHQNGRPMRAIVLKARQMGISTLAQALLFQDTATRHHVNSMVIAHREDATANLFGISKQFYSSLPEPIRPSLRASNARELIFDSASKGQGHGLGSKLRCVTASGGKVGRSDTLTNLHISEFAFWDGNKKEILAGLLQAVPHLAGTMVLIESTANGFDFFREFFIMSEKGETDFAAMFSPWHSLPEYRMMPPEKLILSGEERELKKRYSLDDAQLYWRRWCIRNNCGGDERMFRQEYPACPDDAFLTTGDGYFPQDIISALLAAAPEPEKRGMVFDYDGASVKSPRFSDGNLLSVFESPQKGVDYVIGADTAGDGSDWFAAHVLNNHTGAQAAVYRRRRDEAAFARELFALGMLYNTALIGVEANYSTYPIRELERLGYPKQFVRVREDDFTGRTASSYGVMTTSVTRPLMLAGLAEELRARPGNIRCRDTLRELATFSYNKSGRPEALPGCHDDLVMSLAIAHYIRPQQRSSPAAAPKKLPKWTADMWEDFESATPDEKKLLLQKWG